MSFIRVTRKITPKVAPLLNLVLEVKETFLDIAAIIHSKLPSDSYISFDEICPPAAEIKVKARFVSSAGNNVTLSDAGHLSSNVFHDANVSTVAIQFH